MKVKNFITAIILSFFLTGCHVSTAHYLSDDNRLNEYEVTLIASGVLDTYMDSYYYHPYNDSYYYDYEGLEINSHIGYVSLITVEDFYGYYNRNPYQGNLEIIGDDMTIYLDVIDDRYVEVTLIDHYDSAYDVQFITTWEALGYY